MITPTTSDSANRVKSIGVRTSVIRDGFDDCGGGNGCTAIGCCGYGAWAWRAGGSAGTVCGCGLGCGGPWAFAAATACWPAAGLATCRWGAGGALCWGGGCATKVTSVGVIAFQ